MAGPILLVQGYIKMPQEIRSINANSQQNLLWSSSRKEEIIQQSIHLQIRISKAKTFSKNKRGNLSRLMTRIRELIR